MERKKNAKRSIIPLVIALAKKQLSSLISSTARNETFSVRLANGPSYKEYLARIANKVDSLTTVIKNFPKIEVNEPIDVSQLENSFRGKMDEALMQLGQLEKVIKETQPSIKFPVVQNVKVTNPTPIQKFSTEEIIQSLEKLEKAIENISIEVPKSKEIKIPEFPKIIGIKEGEDILKELKDVKKSLDALPKKYPEIDIPKTVSIDNFPPTHVPTPVTNININPLRGFAKSRNITVTTSLTPLPDEILSYRRGIIVFNNDSTNSLFIGGSDVTTTNGLPVPPKTYSPPIDAGPKLVVYGIASASINVRVLEVSNENIGG